MNLEIALHIYPLFLGLRNHITLKNADALRHILKVIVAVFRLCLDLGVGVGKGKGEGDGSSDSDLSMFSFLVPPKPPP